MVTRWQLRHHPTPELPPMSWLAILRGGTAPSADLYFGSRVRASDAGIFEGTWVGERNDLGPLDSTTPFGSGVLFDGAGLYLVPPGHMLEGIYVRRQPPGTVVATNSLAGLLAATDLELDPDVDYPSKFNESVDGIMRTSIPVSDGMIDTVFYDNVRIEADGRLESAPKRREQPFTDFHDYRSRLSSALASALSNAPSYAPAVTVSSGYDGAAVAVLAEELGCRTVVTIAQGKPVPGKPGLSDSGEYVGKRLGMEVHSYERLAYRKRRDLPEAEFLANGFTGEEVVFSQMENDLEGRMLVSAFFGDGMWWLTRPPRQLLWRSDQSGSSLGEWRMRVGFVHVPLPCFGGHDYRVTQRISQSAAMRPWVIHHRYDKPIPRRILEEAGVPRGTFGEVKRAASATIHADGPSALAPATLASVESFAASEGRRVTFRHRGRALWERVALKLTRMIGLESIAARVERRKLALAVMEPQFGSLLLRWAISVVRPRYSAVAGVASKASMSSRSGQDLNPE